MKIELTINGRGGHSSRPEQCDNPIESGLALIRKLKDVPGLSVVSFDAGNRGNIIPDTARLVLEIED